MARARRTAYLPFSWSRMLLDLASSDAALAALFRKTSAPAMKPTTRARMWVIMLRKFSEEGFDLSLELGDAFGFGMLRHIGAH